MALTFGTVTGRFTRPVLEGGVPVPAAGNVTFRLSPLRLVAAGEPAIVLPDPVTVLLDAQGVLPATQLVATDDPGLKPAGWTWSASCDFGAFWSYQFAFELPGGTTVDLATVTPVPSADGTAIVVGPAGPPGVSVVEVRDVDPWPPAIEEPDVLYARTEG